MRGYNSHERSCVTNAGIQRSDSLTAPEERRRGFPFGLKFAVAFFTADAFFRGVSIYSMVAGSELFGPGISGFLKALFNERAALVYVFIALFDLMLVIQLSLRMGASRIWAVVFAVLQIFNLILDPMGRNIIDSLGILGRIQVVVGAAAFAFIAYYCMTHRMKEFLNK